jgi:hypothetical protein
MPDGAVYVGRPSRFGNPWPIGGPGPDGRSFRTAAEAIAAYEEAMGTIVPSRDEIREVLRGKDLACWCRLDQPCHADVLMKIANR